jgi:hypothetical protein
MLAMTLAAACAASPTPSPANMTGVLNELAAHGASLVDVVGGDAGCSDASLQGNGTRLTLRFALDGRDYDVYLFRWRRASDYEAADGAFDACSAAFAAAGGAGTGRLATVEVFPWRAFGIGWTEAVRDAVVDSLTAAAAGS